MSDRRRVRVVITGRVQGVGYRAFARQEAEALRVSGWVANRDDGSVEAEAEGPAGAIARFLVALRRGPSYSAVEGVDVTEEAPRGENGGFRIAR